MDRKLIVGAFILLFIQIFLLVTDIDIYPGVEDSASSSGISRIGIVADKKRSVKRRGQGSVVWEESDRSDTLMGYDSILTLENSSAKLELDHNIQINLHENTLVVLEPPTTESDDSLRIRFSRGGLFSRNPTQKIHLGSGEWQLDAMAGTDLSLKTLNDENVEVEISTGSVEVQSTTDPQKTKIIQRGSRFTLSQTDIGAVQKLTTALAFDNRREERIYSHEFPVNFLARWQGQADHLRFVQPGRAPRHIDLAANAEDLSLELMPGTYYLSLARGDEISAEIAVRVLLAPKIRYTSPLPRDRFHLGTPVLFSWLPLEGAAKYEIELTGENGERIREPTEINQRQTPVELEGAVQLRVFGLDDLGFRMSPQYSLPLYMLRDPLAPPKLQSPRTLPPRTPAEDDSERVPKKRSNEESKKRSNDGAHLHPLLKKFLELLVPAAHAEPVSDARPVVFSWYKVPGADFYTIEISSEPNFANPEVIAKAWSETFAWTSYHKKVYYWRVAAGANSGRMGLFSDTAMLDLTKIDHLPSGEVSPGVKIINTQYRERVTKPLPPVPTPKPPPAKAVAAPVATPPPAPRIPEPVAPGKWNFIAEYDLHYLNYSFEREFKARLAGVANMALTVGAEYKPPSKTSDEKFYRIRWSFVQADWEPEDSTVLPYQDVMPSSSHGISGLYFRNRRDLAWGLHVMTLPVLEREALEDLKMSSEVLVGPQAAYDLQIANGLCLESSASVLTGSGYTSINNENKMRYQVKWFKQTGYVGGDFNFNLFFGSDSASGFYLRTGVHMGFGW